MGRLRKTSINKAPSAVLGAELAAWVGFQFLAQLPHVDAQILGVIRVGWTPDVRKDASHVFSGPFNEGGGSYTPTLLLSAATT